MPQENTSHCLCFRMPAERFAIPDDLLAKRARKRHLFLYFEESLQISVKIDRENGLFEGLFGRIVRDIEELMSFEGTVYVSFFDVSDDGLTGDLHNLHFKVRVLHMNFERDVVSSLNISFRQLNRDFFYFFHEFCYSVKFSSEKLLHPKNSPHNFRKERGSHKVTASEITNRLGFVSRSLKPSSP